MSGKELVVEKVEACPPFHQDVALLKSGYYTITPTDPTAHNSAFDGQVQSKVWFSTPPLSKHAVDRLAGLQLVAECHDQGFAGNLLDGNWTWFELQIRANEGAKDARVKNGFKLAWKCQYNRFVTKEFGWSVGDFFDGEHDIFTFLEPGNVISVNLCARFASWEIFARKGYLVLKLEN